MPTSTLLHTTRRVLTGAAMGVAVAMMDGHLLAQGIPYNPFQPLGPELPTPSERRLASGAPGPEYWQQRADYALDILLDDATQRIQGKGTVTYHNNSPHTLHHLWVQLDQNEQNPHALARRIANGESVGEPSNLDSYLSALKPTFRGGMQVSSVTDPKGNLLPYTVVETNMRIDLPKPLMPGEQFRFNAEWTYSINNARLEGKSGYEYFPADGNYIYEIAQFFPRMAVYDDVDGWQNSPYLGNSEFSLEFGNYDVCITVPEDHVVAATGDLVNAGSVLSEKQNARLAAIRNEEGVVDFVVTPKEAAAACSAKLGGNKTWVFHAENVRDFAFASSRRFIWDAAAVTIGGRKVIAQSLYPKESMPLWDKYATHTILHTLQVYGRMIFDYPYSTATAINGPVFGMEYPMISFCAGRPMNTGFYSRQSKYITIGVIIHEVGHNFFPMVVNNDERRWAWMDEGLNSFCQYIAEDEFEPNFPYRRGPADPFASYSKLPGQQAIMTNPDAIRDNGKISYEKVAVGLTILRNEVMGPELFDDAFKAYARRWAYLRPEPADFFRSIEDMSGMKLAWFWREWFYGVGHVDLAIQGVTHYKMAPEKAPKDFIDPHLEPRLETVERRWYIDDKPELKDKYTELKQVPYSEGMVDNEILADLLEDHKKGPGDLFHLYQVRIKNQGTCLMPVRLQVLYEDGSSENFAMPAEIWMQGQTEFLKLVYTPKAAVAFHLDPSHALPDVDRGNNVFPNPAIGYKMLVHDLRQ